MNSFERTLRACGFLTALFAVSLNARAVEISTVVHSAIPTASGEPLTGTLTAIPFGLTNRAERDQLKKTLQTTVPGNVQFELPPDGQWRVSIDVPGYFSDAQIVAGGPGAASTRFILWPTGYVAGEFARAKGVEAPRQAIVRFEAHEPAAADAPPASFSVCELGENQWRCEVAAGRIDLRLRATGFITHFRGGLDVKPGKTVNLGTLRLERGASVVGFVQSAERAEVMAARVILTPASHEHRQHAKKGSLSARVQNKKGLFEFHGVAPGEYRLSAISPPLSSDEISLLVQDGAEAEVREPLVLMRPRRLRVRIDPPLQPSAKRWHVAIARELSSSRSEIVSESAADENGEFTWSGLRAGKYSVSVGESSESAQALQEFLADTEDVDLSINVPNTRVEGTVTLGTTPLESTVIIGGSTNPVSARLESGPDGRFSGVVPFTAGDTWQVTVERDRPRLQRTLRYHTDKPVADEPVQMKIALPAGAITGRVVDADRLPIDRATVNVKLPSMDEGFIQVQAERDGTFVLEGLTAGSYELQAWTFDRRDSDIVTVSVTESGNDPPVRLIVLKQNEVLGQVVSRAGPVQGARVSLDPTDVPSMVTVPRATHPDGVFVLTVPRGCKEADIAVNALGLPFRMQHILLDGKPLTIALDLAAGTIEVDVPELSENLAAPQGFVLHKGALMPILFFVSTRDTQIAESSREGHVRITIPLMEGGDYALCRLTWAERRALGGGPPPPKKCTYGALVPFGTLSLATP